MNVRHEVTLTFPQLKALMASARRNNIPITQTFGICCSDGEGVYSEWKEYRGSRVYTKARNCVDPHIYPFYEDARDPCPATLLVRDRDYELFRLMI
jgi:hypothetical protein